MSDAISLDTPADAMWAGTVPVAGHGGDTIEAYVARPLAPGPHGGVVVIHHMPGYDPATKEIVRRFAAEGFAALCPNLHFREKGDASWEDAAAAARAAGGVPDDRAVGDIAGAVQHLRDLGDATGKVGAIGYCSGGRQAFLAACSLPLDAAVDCYGAFVVNEPPAELPVTMKPVLGLAPNLSCPLLGLFGADDRFPSPDETAELAAELSRHGKAHEFHTFPGAGHSFFSVDRTAYRPEAAAEGWRLALDFFRRHLNAS
jgi:carboxymethylenebutenolidase